MLRTLAVSALTALALGAPSFASDRAQPYSEDAFEAAQRAGEPILVDVTASWCPTCARQGEILDTLLENADFSDLTVFEVDFDDQKDAVRAFRAPRQSTLVVFRGEQETGRAVAITSEGDIEALLRTAYAD
jgi:thioredoxin 1